MYASGREALQAFLAGQAQIQTVSETPLVHAAIQGNKFVIVAVVARNRETKLIAREAVERAAKLVGAHDFISTFSEGYETVVGERGY